MVYMARDNGSRETQENQTLSGARREAGTILVHDTKPLTRTIMASTLSKKLPDMPKGNWKA